jgi:hypothetical protein
VMEGTGPISLPIPFVAFKLDGQKFGTLERVVLLRETPKQISSVELQIKLRDSVLARGLEGCRLAANFEAGHGDRGVRVVKTDPLSSGVFSCFHGRDSVAGLQEFGRAVFQPGNISVPLLLPDDVVNDLKKGDFGSDEDSAAAISQARADSIADAAEARADSITTAAEARASSIQARGERLADSLREEGERRADSTRRAASRMADSARGQ